MTPEEWTNKGAKALAAGNLDKALKAFNAALKVKPDLSAAHINRMMVRMTRGNFEGGFEDYEYRFQRPEMAAMLKRAAKPRWTGAPLDDAGLHVWTEQGLGDQILTLSALPSVLNHAKRCLLECESRLVPLLGRSFPSAEVVDVTATGRQEVFAADLTVQAPAYDLIRYQWPTPEAISPISPYLIADPEKTEALRARYQSAAPGKPLVGISWMSPKSARGSAKSIPLAEWNTVLSRDDIALLSLQYHWDGSGRNALENGGVLFDQSINPTADLDTWAAQIAAMDLVITVSTSVAHFAGALGVPVLTLVPKPGEGLLWYWFEKRADSPWYPKMTLARQTAKGWASAFVLTNERLDQLVANQ